MKKKNILLLPLMLMLASCSFSSNDLIDNVADPDTNDPGSGTSEGGNDPGTGDPGETAKGFNVSFNVDDHVSVTVYKTKDFLTVDEDATYQTRNGDTGEYCDDGEESQINFKLTVEQGYEIETITATAGTYNKIKWPSDTLVDNGYRVTKISADTVISVTSKSVEADPEGYKVSFVLTNCTVQVHVGKDTTTTDVADGSGNYFTRDKDSGEYTKNTDTAQMNFTVVPSNGYKFESGVEAGGEAKASNIDYITGSYNKLKNNDNGWFTVTKVSSDLIISISCIII